MKILGLHIDRYTYVSKYIVWAIDVFFTSVSFVICDMFLHYLVSAPVVSGLIWLGTVEAFVAGILTTYLFKTYDGIIRHTATIEFGRVIGAMFFKDVFIWLMAYVWFDFVGTFLIAICLADFLFSSFVLMILRISVATFYKYIVIGDPSRGNRTLIYGVSDTTTDLLENLKDNDLYVVVGFLTTNKEKYGYKVSGYPVYWYGDMDDLDEVLRTTNVKNILFSSYNALQADKRLLDYGLEHDVKMRLASVSEADSTSGVKQAVVRDVKIEDLLNREEIKIDMNSVRRLFENKTVMVTGAAGSIGSELCRQLCHLDVRKLVVLDFAETPLYRIDMELNETCKGASFVPVIADVRNKQRMQEVFEMYRPQFVFHAAAYKHVPMMEHYPCEAIIDNVNGSRNVADLAVEYGVEKFIMISTDKAVHPSSVMGASKRLAERYIQSLGEAIQKGSIKGCTSFITTRFGNVLGSNGSVVPLFKHQIAEGGPITVTHPDIIRYFMTIPEACRLVLEAAVMGSGEDVFVFDMGEPVKIDDMARRMIRLCGLVPDKDIAIKYVGLRPGEKLFEELLYDKENVIPTKNKKIFRARIVSLDYNEVKQQTDKLLDYAFSGNPESTVRQMKHIISDYHSLNSDFVRLEESNADEGGEKAEPTGSQKA